MNADAVADVIARAQHAVARARRLTESYQHRLIRHEDSNLATSSADFRTNGAQPAEASLTVSDEHQSTSTPSTSATSQQEDGGLQNIACVPSYIQPHTCIAPPAPELQPDNGNDSTAAAAEQPSSHSPAVEALVERLVSMPLLTASHRLAQLHTQQARTLRQLLELRGDQLRWACQQLSRCLQALPAQSCELA